MTLTFDHWTTNWTKWTFLARKKQRTTFIKADRVASKVERHLGPFYGRWMISTTGKRKKKYKLSL